MCVAIVTGSAGLIGSETTRFFAEKGLEVIGVDNDLRSRFFGPEASTAWNRKRLEEEVSGYRHLELDIRDRGAVDGLISRLGMNLSVIVHTAAQPSHDWAAQEPFTDFDVNAVGTLNLLESCRRHAPEAVFLFTSTNKVYGDTPNLLPLIEQETRWELDPAHPFAAHGIDETMTIDASLHSLFGASKLAADVLVQEYGRYFGMSTACFRCGCVTGPGHSATMLHGFLAYLVRCAVEERPYSVIGYGGKQVRDNIHALDLVRAFWAFFEAPRAGEVYNVGGGRASSCSVLEAIACCERVLGQRMSWTYQTHPRRGDHMWWVTDVNKFAGHYPQWSLAHDFEGIISEIASALTTCQRSAAGWGP